MKPTVGRIVHYRTRGTETLPLLITHVHSDTVVSGVVLSAFSYPANGHVDRTKVVRSVCLNELPDDHPDVDNHPHTWRWPPRV